MLLPKFGTIDRYMVYLDSLAKRGRSTLDALAIELLKPEMVAVEARYPAEIVRKVEDAGAMMYGGKLDEAKSDENS